MFHFTDDLKQKQFFFFEKHLISNMNWAMLPKASKTIYPIIRAFCGPKGESFPGEETIAMQSGRTEKVVRSGIRGLKGFPGIRLEAYTSKRGRSSKKFTCKIPQYEKGKMFPFHRDILEGGNWAMLKPTAQALYPVMRFFGYADYEEYFGIVDAEKDDEQIASDMDFSWETFKYREFDFCEAEPSTLCKYAGISRRSYAEATKDLEKHFFIAKKPDETWKFMVYLHPPKYYKREFMHKEAIKRRVEKDA